MGSFGGRRRGHSSARPFSGGPRPSRKGRFQSPPTCGLHAQRVPSAGESTASFPLGGPAKLEKGRLQSPPAHEPAAHPPRPSRKKYPTAHVAASARGRAENKVDSGLPRWVVPVLGAIGNFPTAKSNKNQLSPEKPIAHTQCFPPTTSSKNQSQSRSHRSHHSQSLILFSVPQPSRKIIDRARNRPRRPPRSRGRENTGSGRLRHMIFLFFLPLPFFLSSFSSSSKSRSQRWCGRLEKVDSSRLRCLLGELGCGRGQVPLVRARRIGGCVRGSPFFENPIQKWGPKMI